MKALKFLLLAIAAILSIASISYYEYSAQVNTAEVEQEMGLYVFIRSKPVLEHEFLGKVNMPEMVWSGKPREMMNIAARRAAKQYPKANGIIIQSENFGDVEAIFIKEK